jgi:DNA repair exonuclease SbcCD ATPase subunit
MKRIVGFTLLFLMALCTPVFAQDVNDLKNQLLGALQTQDKLHDNYLNMNHELDSINSQLHDVNLDQEMYDKALAKHDDWANKHNDEVTNNAQEQQSQIAKAASYNSRNNANIAATTQHNANKCYYPPDNPSACAAYDAEAHRQDAEAAQLGQERAYLTTENTRIWGDSARLTAEADRVNADKARVDAQGQNLNDAIAAYKKRAADFNARKDKHNADWEANQAKIARILSDLKQIGVQVGNCENALKDTRDGALENIHSVCGSMFDGNRP